ncbi:hypothetical protein PITCH_A1330016 [uncultured Desulfobacterium sp.]|uniref:Uncharacterized protein n=1 Tax=uncultured Desulfobacterium sp. TaxID=201089 RepID=A0A445MSI0_9BACT|nr:hypothetical protein PITCH_A1330016 [uncultured Desulfobacterium sp.]
MRKVWSPEKATCIQFTQFGSYCYTCYQNLITIDPAKKTEDHRCPVKLGQIDSIYLKIHEYPRFYCGIDLKSKAKVSPNNISKLSMKK